MSALEEAAKWGIRALRLIPEIAGLWEAAKADDANAIEEAKADLVVKMKRQQAIEEMGGGP